MRADEVNEFLTKALYEPEINAKDPFEVVCWYCFEFCSKEQPHYPLNKKLWNQYLDLPDNLQLSSVSDEKTGVFKSKLQTVHNEPELLRFLQSLKFVDDVSYFGITAYQKFMELYEAIQKHIVDLEDLKEESSTVTAYKVQNYLCPGQYVMKKEYLQADKKGIYRNIFSAKRLSEQRLSFLLKRKKPVERSDLITMKFLEICLRYEIAEINKGISEGAMDQELNTRRTKEFFKQTNALLTECFMHELIMIYFQTDLLDRNTSVSPLEQFRKNCSSGEYHGVLNFSANNNRHTMFWKSCKEEVRYSLPLKKHIRKHPHLQQQADVLLASAIAVRKLLGIPVSGRTIENLLIRNFKLYQKIELAADILLPDTPV